MTRNFIIAVYHICVFYIEITHVFCVPGVTWFLFSKMDICGFSCFTYPDITAYFNLLYLQRVYLTPYRFKSIMSHQNKVLRNLALHGCNCVNRQFQNGKWSIPQELETGSYSVLVFLPQSMLIWMQMSCIWIQSNDTVLAEIDT